MVLGPDDVIAGGAFTQHMQVHELAGVVLHVKGTLAATMTNASAENLDKFLYCFIPSPFLRNIVCVSEVLE